MIKKWPSSIYLIGQGRITSPEPLKSINVKTVRIVNCVQNTQEYKEGNNQKIYDNEKWKQQKAYTKQQLSEKETGKIYDKRKINVEPVFGFLKATLGFARMSVRSKKKAENELGFAFMAVNLRKYTAKHVNGQQILKII